ncbi:MAG: hypothetical protein QXV61_01875 [Archaeoglobaceae archaeon]
MEIDAGFNVLNAPEEICVDAISSLCRIGGFSALFVSGNGSKIVGKLKGRLTVRRGFTIHQLMEILLDAHEEVIFVEHDASIFENCSFKTLEDFVFLLRQLGKEKTLIYFSTRRDRVFDFIAGLADRYVYVERGINGYHIADVGVGGIRQLFFPIKPQLTLEVF